jgi:hypothetical protein
LLDSETRASLDKAIRDHLATKGATEWNPVRKQFPQVPLATFWRHVAKEKARPAPKAQIDEARAKIAVTLANTTADERRAAAAGTMPCIPSPAYIAKAGSDGMRHLDLLARLDGLLADADRLRGHAMNEAGDIVDAELFSDSIELGMKLIGAAVKSIDAVYDQRRQLAFYDAIVDEITAASPETSARIIARLQKLNEERGYSFGVEAGGLSAVPCGRTQ